MYYKLDPETKRVIPTDMNGYVEMHKDHESHIVKQEQVGPWFVSTVFLGLCHRFIGDGQPIVFETMVFNNPKPEDPCGIEDYCDRYCTWDEAIAGHEKAKAEYVQRVADSTEEVARGGWDEENLDHGPEPCGQILDESPGPWDGVLRYCPERFCEGHHSEAEMAELARAREGGES